MLKALMLRKTSPFGKKEWRVNSTVPEQNLYDLGFDLAALLHQADEGVYNVDACTTLHASFEELSKKLTDIASTINLLACQLLLGFVMSSLGLDWAAKRAEQANTIVEMLPLLIRNGEEHRSIFPLTCVMLEFREDQAKYGKAVNLVEQVVRSKKVRFAEGTYQGENWMPNIARSRGH